MTGAGARVRARRARWLPPRDPRPRETGSARVLLGRLLVPALAGALVAGCATGAPEPGPVPVAPDLTAPGPAGAPPPTGPPTGPVTGPPVPGADFRGCEGGVGECATVTVPVDHADPTGPTLEIALVRMPARDQAAKVGVLLVNPGGPGGSGVEFVQRGAVTDEVADRFDVVGFDPRGVGASQGLSCPIGPDVPYQGDPDPGDPVGEATTSAAVDRYTAACGDRYGDLLPHLGTRNVARDMDLIREALGQETINYLGYSYGTSIGQTYAQLFSRRIRTMVLDGVVDQSRPGLDSAQAASFESAFGQFADACRVDAACAAGPDPAAVLDRVRARVSATPMAAPGRAPLSAGLLEIGVVYPLYNERSWPALAAALAAADRGDPQPMLQLADAYFEGTNSDAYNAVTCLDNSWPTDPAQVLASARATEAVAPRFAGNVLVSGLTCASWPAPQQPLLPLTGYTGPPMVVLGTRGDPATPYRNSVDLARRLPGSALISYDGEGHTVYGSAGVACVDDQVDRYLVDGVLPTRPNC